MLNGLDLFSGIGGITLALREWVRPVAYCEIEPYATGVLFSRMLDGSIPTAPIFPDIRHLTARILPSIDIIYGGFPCQDVSVAGLRKGLDGERTGLFREAVRLIRECRPQFVFLENVPGIRRYVPSVRGELEALGYSCRDGLLSAAECGAPHIRNRWWLLANSERNGGRAWPDDGSTGSEEAERKNSERICSVGELADAESHGLQGSELADFTGCGAQGGQWTSDTRRSGKLNSWWVAEPNVGRVAHGVPLRTHRIKSLGNAVVPPCARKAFKILAGLS